MATINVKINSKRKSMVK